MGGPNVSSNVSVLMLIGLIHNPRRCNSAPGDSRVDDPGTVREAYDAQAAAVAAGASAPTPALREKYQQQAERLRQDGFIYMAPVGRYNPNGWGLFAMHGNVWEWCWDGYAADDYKRSPVDDPPGPDGAASRVDRGGGWDFGPRRARSAFRAGTRRRPGRLPGLSPGPSPVRPLSPGISLAGVAEARPAERRSRGAEGGCAGRQRPKWVRRR